VAITRGSFLFSKGGLAAYVLKSRRRLPRARAPQSADMAATASSETSYFQARAIECQRKADEASDPQAAQQLRTAAATWRELAKLAAQHGW
jgi:hypothetical protein